MSESTAIIDMDEILASATQLIIKREHRTTISIAWIQSRYGLGYLRAEEIMGKLERNGAVKLAFNPTSGTTPRVCNKIQ